MNVKVLLIPRALWQLSTETRRESEECGGTCQKTGVSGKLWDYSVAELSHISPLVQSAHTQGHRLHWQPATSTVTSVNWTTLNKLFSGQTQTVRGRSALHSNFKSI